jgi:hypothetical protein
MISSTGLRIRSGGASWSKKRSAWPRKPAQEIDLDPRNVMLDVRSDAAVVGLRDGML